MARSYGKVFQRIWADPEWRSLDVAPQHLYVLLISQPTMNLAGILPKQLRRWSSCVADWDEEIVGDALDVLTERGFTVVDEDTEEVLVRSLVRNDEAYKTPGMLKSILRFAEAAQAVSIRETLAVELGKLEPLEGKTAEANMALIAATRLALMPRTPGPGSGVIHSSEGIPDGIADTFVSNPSAMASPMPSFQSTEGIPDTSVSVSGSVTSLALVRNQGEEGSSAALSDDPPPCKKHQGMHEDDIPPCRACGRARENWKAERAIVAELAATEAAKPKPMCRKHAGQIAAHCSPCRSEQIGVA